jgi:hypothetical protein
LSGVYCGTYLGAIITGGGCYGFGIEDGWLLCFLTLTTNLWVMLAPSGKLGNPCNT